MYIFYARRRVKIKNTFLHQEVSRKPSETEYELDDDAMTLGAGEHTEVLSVNAAMPCCKDDSCIFLASCTPFSKSVGNCFSAHVSWNMSIF